MSKAKEEYLKAKIELVKAACDLASDLMRVYVERRCGLPRGSLGRSERKKEEEKV